MEMTLDLLRYEGKNPLIPKDSLEYNSLKKFA